MTPAISSPFTRSKLVPAAILCGLLLLSSARALAQAPPAAAAPTPPPAPPKWTLNLTHIFENPGGGVADQNETQFNITRHVNRRSTVFVEIDQHNRYDDLDTAIMFGAGHAFGARHLFLVSASIAFGFNDPVNIPKREYQVKGSLRATPKVSPLFAFDRQYFSSVNYLNKLTAGANFTPHANVSIQPVYVVSSAGIHQNLTATGQAFGLQASIRRNPRFAFIFTGGYGHEHALEHILTRVELVRTIKQLDLEPGVELKVGHNRDLKLSYTYSNKHTLYNQHGLIADFTVSF